MNTPLVSIIVPTLNSQNTLEACLVSIKQQAYPAIELIVVDNHSKDATPDIAKKYANAFFSQGPERSAQRNFGVAQATGDYVVIIDSDMELGKKVIEACVEKVLANPEVKGVVIPEESFGEGFWAECKRLERSFYVGVDWMEAARFFDKKTYQDLGGYDLNLVSGEDWDLSQRVAKVGIIERVSEFIRHNEGNLKLGRTLRKKYYYAQKFASYTDKQEHADSQASQTGIVSRYKLFLTKPKKLFSNPIVGLGMLFMKTCEFGFGGLGYILAKRKGGAA